MIKRCPVCRETYRAEDERCPLDDATLVAERDPRIGRVLAGRWRLDALVGEGGMGAVFRATHVHLLRQAAVKILEARLGAEPIYRKRFLREARAVNLLRHEALVEVYDVGEEESSAWMVMELLEGESLAQRLVRGPLSPAEVVELAIPVARALGRAHAAGVIHRDIKPANLFLCAPSPGRARVRVIDFGVAHVRGEARLTRTNEILGTLDYMAPEQCLGMPCEPATDLYALGVTLFELLTGRVPFEGSMATLTLKHAKEPPPDLAVVAPAVPSALAALVAKLLAKSPRDRPASADAVADALDRMRTLEADEVVAVSSFDERLARETRLAAAVAAAFPAGPTPWVSRRADDLRVLLERLHAVERRVHEVTREVERVERESEAARARTLEELAEADAALARAEVAVDEQSRVMQPSARAAEQADLLLARAWLDASNAVRSSKGPDDESLAALERLAREAAAQRAAQAALKVFEDERATRERRYAEAEARCHGLRQRLASHDADAREALAELRARAVSLGAQAATYHQAFELSAEHLERFLADYPAASGILAADEGVEVTAS